MTIDEVRAKMEAVRKRHAASSASALRRSRLRLAQDAPPAAAISEVLSGEVRAIRSIDASISAFVEHLKEHEPQIFSVTNGFSYRGTTLTISVSGSAAVWLVDGWARQGGLSLARQISRSPINRIKVVVEVK